MDKLNATILLRETFNKDFDENNFIRFVKELFNEIAIKPVDRSYAIAKEYGDYISSIVKFGEYIDEEKNTIEILAVKLKKSSSIDRARTMQRNFIASWLGKYGINAALVAFYGDDEDWRFSFVKMEYNLMKDETGKVRVSKELTPAKRYSFLVGKNEPNHTCQSRFVELLTEDVANPSLEQIENAFSIEKVTKEFFEKYKELFHDLEECLRKMVSSNGNLKREFVGKSISTVDFSKKLLGQIVFLYFLQKKGWLGVPKNDKGKFMPWGTGPKNFMRKLFDKKIIKYDNFFNDVLEPLFYEALATDRDDDYYRYFDCKIPFLNGGLFEPINDYNWRETDLLFDNDIFVQIFDTFDQFNFTVKEDEPLEKEVAVDPEMLGKVFENLLDVKDRKSKGAFYTPREIVHYMCQESLINYLENNTKIPKGDIEKFIQSGDLALAQIIREEEQKKKYGKYESNPIYSIPESVKSHHKAVDTLLQEIKIVDPACGSGAFLLGMMNEIVKVRSLLSIFFGSERKSYDLKREAIENCLYGVDIEPSATEITKLRFWLSLIVDENDIKTIKPLPNLDHKIMCGNSLLEEFNGIKLFDDRLLGEPKKDFATKINEIHRQLQELYTNNDSNTQKKIDELLKQRKILETEARKSKTSQVSINQSLEKKIKESEIKFAELRKLQKEYFNEQVRKRKNQLRNDIDNIEWELIEETLKEQGNEKSLNELLQYRRNNAKPFFLWKLYFAEVFQRANPGFDVVIANPPWEKFKPLDPEFFSNYCENYTELSKSKQKSKREELLKNPKILSEYTRYIKKYEDDAIYFKEHYELQGSGDLNLYKLFLERAYKISSGNVVFLIPGQITIDNGSITFRETFLKDKSLWRIIGLINRKGIFENVHLEQRFVLIFLDKRSPHDIIEIYGWSYYFKNFSNSQLLKLDRKFFENFDENKTYCIYTNKSNFDIFNKIKESTVSIRLNKLGYHIWREYDVTLDSEYFNDEMGKYKLSSGQAIDQFDCMAKKWLEKHGRSSRWEKFGFPKKKDYRTEYFVDNIPERIIEHHKTDSSNFRIVTQTVTGAVTNARTLNAAILPKNFLTNNSLNNLFIGHNNEELFYYLAILDSFVVDWQIRAKVASNINKFIIDGILVPKFESVDPKIREKIYKDSVRLSAISEDFNEITQEIFGKKHSDVLISDEKERQEIKNELNYLVSKIWKLNKKEMEDILNSFPLVQSSIKSDIIRRIVD